ncbi:hypothetical protein P3T39_007383, partial [Kitasatospora sp. GP82]|nr:hypothetical protein [Kitasatospora sp. GP82]
PQTLITTAPASGRAHGIGVASGPRPAVATRAAGRPRPWGSRTVPASSSGSSYGSSPGAAAGPAPADSEIPVVNERTPNGLPQRRRRRHAAPSRTGVPETSTIPGPAQAPVQPGMWLAAFHEGVNGHAPSTGAAGHTSEESAEKGEQ